MERPHWSHWLTIGIAMLALVATVFNVLVAQSNEQVAIFAQFQQEYSEVAARFPKQMLDENFRPPQGSDDYKKLEDYWIFAYAEWFGTEKNGPIILGTNLWTRYYAGLITDALEIPSLRYVLEDMIRDSKTKRKDMAEFFDVLRQLAERDGKPLS